MDPRISKNIRIIVAATCLLLTAWLNAADRFVFDTETQRANFDSVLQNLRCLVCQNQSLAESHAHFAESLKAIIYEKVKAGQSEAFIIDSITAKYGDYIRYQPPFRMSTLLLWLGPFLFFVWCVFRLRSKKAAN